MKKGKGFTLIELLAVIVILIAIAVIVTPIVCCIFKCVRNSADLRSAKTYVLAGENYYGESYQNEDMASKLGTNIINDLEVSGDIADGFVAVDQNGNVEAALIIHDKCYLKRTSESIEDIEVSDDTDNCEHYLPLSVPLK